MTLLILLFFALALFGWIYANLTFAIGLIIIAGFALLARSRAKKGAPLNKIITAALLSIGLLCLGIGWVQKQELDAAKAQQAAIKAEQAAALKAKKEAIARLKPKIEAEQEKACRGLAERSATVGILLRNVVKGTRDEDIFKQRFKEYHAATEQCLDEAEQRVLSQNGLTDKPAVAAPTPPVPPATPSASEPATEPATEPAPASQPVEKTPAELAFERGDKAPDFALLRPELELFKTDGTFTMPSPSLEQLAVDPRMFDDLCFHMHGIKPQCLDTKVSWLGVTSASGVTGGSIRTAGGEHRVMWDESLLCCGVLVRVEGTLTHYGIKASSVTEITDSETVGQARNELGRAGIAACFQKVGDMQEIPEDDDAIYLTWGEKHKLSAGEVWFIRGEELEAAENGAETASAIVCEYEQHAAARVLKVVTADPPKRQSATVLFSALRGPREYGVDTSPGLDAKALEQFGEMQLQRRANYFLEWLQIGRKHYGKTDADVEGCADAIQEAKQWRTDDAARNHRLLRIAAIECEGRYLLM